MGLVSRGRGAVCALALAALLAGCGGSVADADSPNPARTTRAAPAQSSLFCAAVAANSEAIRPLNGLTLRGTMPADQLTATVDAARASAMELLTVAPDGIRDDVQRTVAAMNTELNALVAARGDTSVALRDPAVLAETNSPEVAAAGQRVSTYVNQNCQASR